MFVTMQHERTPTSQFMDKMMASHLQKFAKDQRDYENLYVMTKKVAHLANNSM